MSDFVPMSDREREAIEQRDIATLEAVMTGFCDHLREHVRLGPLEASRTYAALADLDYYAIRECMSAALRDAGVTLDERP